MALNPVVLKGKKVGRPNGARERYIVGNDREGTTDVMEYLPPARISRELPNYESRAPPGVLARQGKETVHLIGNRKTWWDDRAGGHCT